MDEDERAKQKRIAKQFFKKKLDGDEPTSVSERKIL